MVDQSWALDAGSSCPLSRLNNKLWRLSKALKEWSKNIVGDIQKQFALVNELILQLDKAQDLRGLTTEESSLRAKLKSRTLGLAVLIEIKRRRRSRVLWLKAGDANTKFFQRRANAHHKRNTIHVLHGPQGLVSSTEDMTNLAHEHFTQIFGTNKHRSVALNWDELSLEHVDLQELEQELSLEEIKRAVDVIPADKAPEPGGFSGGLLQNLLGHDQVGPARCPPTAIQNR